MFMNATPTPDEQDIKSAVEQLSRDDLLALIQRMVRQHPDLAGLIVSKQPTATRKPRAPFNAEVYHLQVEKIFYTTDRNTWGSEDRAAEPLLDIVDIADEYVEHHDFTDAAALYKIIIRGILDNYDSFRWHADEGQLDDVVEDCVEGLSNCLRGMQDNTAVRRQILQTLFDVYDFDTNLESDGIADETFLRISREMESYHYVVDRLLKLGRLDEALAEAKHVENYDILEIADILSEHGYDAEAERLIEERVERYNDTDLLHWLQERYQSGGNLAGAMEMAKRTFTTSHFGATIERYREIRQLAQRLDRWDEVRSELLAYVKQLRKTDVEIEIALDEDHIDLALELLKAGEQTKDLKNGPYGSTNLNVGIEVAKAAEENYPQEAIEIYQRYVVMRIEWRGRENYHTACQYLLSIRKLYQKIGKSNEWTTYIADLREHNARLPALKDEMAKAKL